jgi:hypothetical protein
VIDATTAALTSQRLVILLNLWQPIAGTPLIPFHLGILWPERCDALALDAVFSFYPHSVLDEPWHELPLYDPAEALTARQAARVKRVEAKASLGFVRADWEQPASQFRRSRRRSLLAGNSFACIQRIQKDGSLNSESRPVLGRHATRGIFKPCVRVLSPSRISPDSLKAFVAVDLAIIDAQNQRGFRATERMREVIRASSETAAIFIASSPSEMYRVRQKLRQDVRVLTVGTPPDLSEVSVVVVSDDRAIAEKEFAFAVDGLDDDAHLTIAARCAWWALRQTIGDDFVFELSRFDELYSQLASQDPAAALRYDGVKTVLHRTASVHPLERRAKAVSSVLETTARLGTLVITRNGQARDALAQVLARELSISLAELEELGVFVVTKQPPSLPRADVAIVTGFFGPDTFDLALNARVKSLVLVVDEIEMRGALWLATALSRICSSAGVVVPALERLKDGLRRFVTGEGEEFGLDLFARVLTSGTSYPGATDSESNPQFVTIAFTDGSIRRVARNTRFDLFKGRLRITTARAYELRSGDAVVLLDHDSHAALSDQLLARLDGGVLREHALKRKAWIDIVRASFGSSGRTITEVARSMTQAGQPVDATTVRTWLIPSAEQDVSVPMSVETTQALAQAVGVQLPEPVVNDFFTSILIIRRRHRHAGRLLARAIRGLQVRRLDIVTIRKLEAEWGFDPKDLLKGARVVEVDEVLGV